MVNIWLVGGAWVDLSLTDLVTQAASLDIQYLGISDKITAHEASLYIRHADQFRHIDGHDWLMWACSEAIQSYIRTMLANEHYGWLDADYNNSEVVYDAVDCVLDLFRKP